MKKQGINNNNIPGVVVGITLCGTESPTELSKNIKQTCKEQV